MASKKSNKIGRSPFSFPRETSTKGTISPSNDHFARGDWGEFQDKHLFNQVELSKSLIKH